MIPTRRVSRSFAALLGLLAFSTTALHAEEDAEVDPRAISALEQMGSYLRGLKHFSISAASQTDQVLNNGQTVEFRHQIELLAQPPDKLRVTVDAQGYSRSLFYNGQHFTLYDSRSHFFTRAPAPANIDRLIDQLNQRYGIELPLADLFRWDKATASQVGITSALLIGSETLGDQTCNHYAYRQPDIDWQLWLRAGPQPLPCRVVISRRGETERPRHSVDFHWQLNAPLTTRAFEFVPPAGARAVPLQQLAPQEPAAPSESTTGTQP
ncbi:DUF2092 domain-containing protein [Pseudomonas purpurea]|uniref:DUF2092 domain-containing protein n=1 Tax=Pseudomonas purpurea TaxID=3136737 RepID=UPI0032668007